MKRLFLLCMVVAGVTVSNIYCTKETATTGPTSEETVTVTLAPNTTYQRNLGTYGRDNGPIILKQAGSFQVSRIDRTDGGNVVYTYLPSEGFTGTDEVVIQILRESNGVDPMLVTYLRIKFRVELQNE